MKIKKLLDLSEFNATMVNGNLIESEDAEFENIFGCLNALSNEGIEKIKNVKISCTISDYDNDEETDIDETYNDILISDLWNKLLDIENEYQNVDYTPTYFKLVF